MLTLTVIAPQPRQAIGSNSTPKTPWPWVAAQATEVGMVLVATWPSYANMATGGGPAAEGSCGL